MEEETRIDQALATLAASAASSEAAGVVRNGYFGTSSTTVTSKPDSMMVTLAYDQRSYVLNLSGKTKASQLLAFAKQEFRLQEDCFILHSEGVGKTLDLSKGLREQIPMFDLVKVVKKTR